jgi:hypothetical protein
MSYLFTKEQGILKDQKKGLMRKKHLIFLVFFYSDGFILALVVKINNDHKKKGQALRKKLELVGKQIH